MPNLPARTRPAEGRVTRNVPPRRCTVNAGCEIEYGGNTYTGDGHYDANLGVHVAKEPDTFLCGEGAVVDEWERDGFVTVEDQTEENVLAAIKAWNGKEGDEIRTAALARVDAHIEKTNATAKRHGLTNLVAERDHTHGFEKYRHADPDNPIEMDITKHRQRLGAAAIKALPPHELGRHADPNGGAE